MCLHITKAFLPLKIVSEGVKMSSSEGPEFSDNFEICHGCQSAPLGLPPFSVTPALRSSLATSAPRSQSAQLYKLQTEKASLLERSSVFLQSASDCSVLLYTHTLV